MTTSIKANPIVWAFPSSTAGTGYYNVPCGWEGSVTGIRISTVLRGTSASPLEEAVLHIDESKKYEQDGRLGASGHDTPTNLPYPVWYTGWMNIKTALTPAEISSRESVLYPDVRMDTMITSSNIINITKTTNAVISLSVDPVYLDGQSLILRTVTAGDVVFVSADALGGWSGEYVVTAVDFGAKTLTTSRDTSGTTADYANSTGGRTIAKVTVFAQTLKTSPAYGVIGSRTMNAPSTTFDIPSIQFRKGSSIINALLKTTSSIEVVNVR